MHKIVYATGLTGFIGSNLLPFLLESYDVVINFARNNSVIIYKKNDTEQMAFSSKILIDYPSNIFINLATLYNPKPLSIKDFNNLIESNINFPLNIIEILLGFNKKLNIVNTSSYMQLLPLKFQNQYSLSKEIFLSRISNNLQNIKNLYLFDSFGKGDTRNKVIDIFIKNIKNNKNISIPSNDIHINISYVDDICTSIKGSIELPGGNYSILSPDTITLELLAKKLMRLIGRDVDLIKLDPSHNLFNEIMQMPENIYPSRTAESVEYNLQRRINEIN